MKIQFLERNTKFYIGEIIKHKLFNYSGVIYSVDPEYMGSEDWHNDMAKTRPLKNQPWYHVLPSGCTHSAYVAESNLFTHPRPTTIEHPMIKEMFARFENARYYKIAN